MKMMSYLDRNESNNVALDNMTQKFAAFAKSDNQKAEWRQSIRDTVEKAIASKVEQRLDTPPLERMRRRQMEAKLKKEQQLRELERSMSITQSAKTEEGDTWRRKFNSVDHVITDSEFLKKLDRMKNPRGASATAPSEHLSSAGSSSADIRVEAPKSPCAVDSRALITIPSDWVDSSNENSDNIFSTTTYETKRLLFRKFCKEGFKEAVRNGSIHSTDCKGVFMDDMGMELSYDGPFWPNHYGPLVKTPNHITTVPKYAELLSFALGMYHITMLIQFSRAIPQIQL